MGHITTVFAITGGLGVLTGFALLFKPAKAAAGACLLACSLVGTLVALAVGSAKVTPPPQPSAPARSLFTQPEPIVPAQAAAPAPEDCFEDYRDCTSQQQLIDTYKGITEAQTSCKRATRQLTRYGDPDLPWLAFGSYFPSENSAKSGRVELIENEAKIPNKFGGVEKVRVKCVYDLKAKKVLDILEWKRPRIL